MQGQLPAPTASGVLRKDPCSLHLLVYALERRLTGTFELSRGSISMATILVMGGCPSKLRTSDPVHFLGNVLLELGMIAPPHLQASLSAMNGPPKQLQGQLLLQMNAVDAARLDAGLRSQVERKVEHLFGLSNDTTFRLLRQRRSRLGAIWRSADADRSVPGALQRGCREQPAFEHVDATFRRIGTALIRLAPTAQVERFAFSQQAGARGRRDDAPATAARAVDIVGALGQRVGQILVYFLADHEASGPDRCDAADGGAAGRQRRRQVHRAASASPAAVPQSQPPSSQQMQAAQQQRQNNPSQSLGRVQLTRQVQTRGPVVVEERLAPLSPRERSRVAAERCADLRQAAARLAAAAPSVEARFSPRNKPSFSNRRRLAQPMQPQLVPRSQTPPAVATPPSAPVITTSAAPAGPLDIGSMIANTIQQLGTVRRRRWRTRRRRRRLQ